MTGTTLITAEQATTSVLDELLEAFFDIPFENSDFQNKAFVVAAQQTPGRAYRAIGLRMHSKIEAVRFFKLTQAKLAIDIEERESKIRDPQTSEFDRRRMILDNINAEEGRAWGEKLLNDALRELNCMYAEFKKLPRYTRDQFEAEEHTHFELSLNRQLSAPGPKEALLNMKHDLPVWDKVAAHAVALLSDKKPEAPNETHPL